MSDSTSVLSSLLLSANQAGKEAKANDLFNSSSPSMMYARNPATTTGLTWGYIGGRFSSTSISSGTVSLTGSTTNYIVAHRTTGAVTVSTSNTNWNDAGTYLRLYSIVTGSASVTSYEDHRQAIGASGGSGGTPGGSSGQLQYNNSGLFSGITGATSDGSYLQLGNQVNCPASAVTAAATTTLNLATGQTFAVAMGTNVTTLTLSNPRDGQTVNVLFTQDGTGSRTIAWPTGTGGLVWPNGTAPALSTAANARDLLVLTYFSTPNIYAASLLKGLA